MTFSDEKKIVANWINRIMNMNNMNALTEWHIIYNSFENIGSVYLILSIIHGLRWYVCWTHSEKNYTYCMNDHALMYEVTIGDVKFVFFYADMTNCDFHIGVCFLIKIHTPNSALRIHTCRIFGLNFQSDSMLKLIYFFDSFIFHLFTNVFFFIFGIM